MEKNCSVTDSEEKNNWNHKKIRNINFDILKGVLILLVVVGHVIPGTLRTTFPRYIIYSFHMPVFIGVSGYLLNFESLQEMSLQQLIKKYWLRIGLPWLIFVNAYYIAMHRENYSIKSYVSAFYYPYGHLWFVLGFLSYIIVTFLLIKIVRKTVKGGGGSLQCYLSWRV